MIGTIHNPCTIIHGQTFSEEARVKRVRGEYRKMPGMRLTIDQAMRLFMLDRHTCSGVLDSLVATHFLWRDSEGRYAKADNDY